MLLSPAFLPPLLGWYERNKRDLPWRRDREPYHVWLSEIMLQQTRVEAVKGYYARFLAELPDIPSLAACDPDRLHKLWEGLGYYSRVRNLQKAAQQIVSDYGGAFPTDYDKIRALPGIGDYTAGAICSICFGQPTPAVDGNVLRVVSRLTADERPVTQPAVKKDYTAALAEIYPAGQCAEATQALMELGATVCAPNGAPHCDLCPVAAFCQSREGERWRTIPVKDAKKPRRAEQKTVFLLTCGDRTAVRKRPATGLLAGLWELPNVDGFLEPQPALELLETWGLRPTELKKQLEKQHIFTHITWQLRCYYVEVSAPDGGLTWVDAARFDRDISLPTAFRQFWETP